MSVYTYDALQDFPFGTVNIGNLTVEIAASAISVALSGVSQVDNTVTVTFKGTLSAAEKTILDGDTLNPAGGLIAEHNSEEQFNLVAQPVLLREDQGNTNGNFYNMCIVMNADADSTTVYEQQVLVNSTVLSVHYETKAEHEGDSMEVYVSPDTVVGVLTSDSFAGDNVFNVSGSVVQNVFRGAMLFELFDGVQSESMGRIVSVDSVNNQVTTEHNATLAFTASTPTYVRATGIFIDTCTFGDSHHSVVGESKVGGSSIPAGSLVRLRYHNRSPAWRVGQITSDVSIGDTVIDVDSDVINNLIYGEKIELRNDSNFSALGTVTKIDKDASQITVSSASTQAFLASGPTFVRKTAKKFIAKMEMLQ